MVGAWSTETCHRATLCWWIDKRWIDDKGETMLRSAVWPDDGGGDPDGGVPVGPDRDPRDAGREVARKLAQRAAWTARDLDWECLVEVARGLGPDPAFADLSDEDVDRRVRVQAAELAASTCQWLELLAELVVRGVWADQGSRTPAQWLSWKIGLAGSTAREHVRIALQLRELPAIRGRFREGRISYSKVRALTRVAVPQIEDMLLRWADAATAAEIERVVAGFRMTQRARAVDPEVRESRRGVTDRLESDGTVTVMIRALPDEAAAIRSMIDRIVDVERTAEAEHPPTADPSPEPTADPTDHRSFGARKVDAVIQALESAVAGGPQDTSGLDRHTVVMHLDADDLVDAPAKTDGRMDASDPTADAAATDGDALTDVGVPIEPTGTPRTRSRTDGRVPVQSSGSRSRSMDRQVIRRLACDAGVTVIVRDDTGTPMDVGRRDRRLSSALRRVVMARDRSCRFPGCGATRHLHAHHVQHWADGGPTDLTNLVLVCSHHHRFVHDHGWTLQSTTSGRFTFVPPGGDPLPAVSEVPDPASADPGDRLRALSFDDPYRLNPDDWPGPGYADIDMVVAVLDQELRAVLPSYLTAA